MQACFQKLIFQHVFNVKNKTKQKKETQEVCEVSLLRTSILQRYKGVVAPEVGPKSFRDFRETGARLELLEAWLAPTSVNYHTVTYRFPYFITNG